MNLFITYLFDDTWFFFSWIIIVCFSICVHEFAHAITALRCGDDTAAREGHLSLNPLVQMGPASLVLLCVIGIAWGAVPVNPGRFRKRSNGALVAFAGPLANLTLSLVFALLAVVLAPMPAFAEVLGFAAVANGVLFVLNMIPVPMLDGWSVFSLFFPKMQRVNPQQAQNISLFALVVIFLSPAAGMVWSSGRWIAAFWMQLFERLM